MKRSPMSRATAVIAFAALTASTAFAHEGHGATPAHLHPPGGFPIDIGSIVIVGVVGVVALAVTVARRRR